MANLISILRVLLAFVVIALVHSYRDNSTIYWWAFGLTVIVIWMDGLDGYVARKLNESSKLGAVIDILGDRVVELLYWISFAVWGWLPLWVPLMVMTRGIVVDGLRAVALEQGFTAFGDTSLMKHPVGVLLVSSRFSRFTYAIAKAAAFCLLILAMMPSGLCTFLLPWALALVYVSVAFCVIRGLPVIIAMKQLL